MHMGGNPMDQAEFEAALKDGQSCFNYAVVQGICLLGADLREAEFESAIFRKVNLS